MELIVSVVTSTSTDILTCILVEPLYASLTRERLFFTDLQRVVFSENAAEIKHAGQHNIIAMAIFDVTFHILTLH